MIEFKHQKLINEYQLDISDMPDELRKAIDSFPELAYKSEGNQQAKVLLEKLDGSLVIKIVAWIRVNENDLKKIVNPDAAYKDFYKMMVRLLPDKKFEKINYKAVDVRNGKGEANTISLIYLKDTRFGDCAYYSLEEYRGEKTGRIIVLKVCGYTETIEPVYLHESEKKIAVMAYDYLGSGPEVDYKAKKMLDKSFKKWIENSIKERIAFSKDFLSEIIPQLIIALNEN